MLSKRAIALLTAAGLGGAVITMINVQEIQQNMVRSEPAKVDVPPMEQPQTVSAPLDAPAAEADAVVLVSEDNLQEIAVPTSLQQDHGRESVFQGSDGRVKRRFGL